MKYLERINNKNAQDKKASEFLGEKSKLQAEADLLAVKQQISEKEQELEKARLAEENYSLTKVGELILEVKDLKEIEKAMKAEYKLEF